MKKKKFYVVWEGREKGVFDSWERCKKSIFKFPNAQYKSFFDKQSAEKAFAGDYKTYRGKKIVKKINSELIKKYGMPNLYSIAVDAACSGNPGKMEYRGVFL